MDPLELAARVAAVERRGAGSDAERRAAALLADALRATSRRRRRGVRVQTEWVRPHDTVVPALLAAVAVVGSVLAVSHPAVGLGLAAGAFVLFAADLSGRFTLLRRLTFARATQNVVSRDPREDARVRLVVTAAVDAPRAGLLARGLPARLQVRARRALRGHLLGPYGLLALAFLAVAALAGARLAGVGGTALGAGQLVPTVILLLAVAAGLDAAAATVPRAGANADASAAAVAVALVAALDARPPEHLAVDCVLAGASGAHALGFRRWVAAERRAGRRAEEVVVLHVAACGRGRPVWWERDGLVLPLRFHPQLVRLARAATRAERHLGARAHETRATSAARAARAAGWPAIAVGALPADGVVPGAGTDADTVDALDPAALRATLELAQLLVAGLDAELG